MHVFFIVTNGNVGSSLYGNVVYISHSARLHTGSPIFQNLSLLFVFAFRKNRNCSYFSDAKVDTPIVIPVIPLQ